MRSLTLVLFMLLTPFAHAGVRWTFENHPYYDPLIAGVRDPHVSALVPAFFDRMAFMKEGGTRRYGWDIDVGAELPIFGRASGDDVGVIAKDEWGWGLWIPIDFHMIEDFPGQSAPIVNTDYRFGGMLKARWGIAENRWIAARLHVGHESTHLGDEFSIHGQRDFPNTFERINVSWEYIDLGVLYEWHNAYEWNVRGGVTSTFPFGESYYQADDLATQSPFPVTESKNWIDPYGGIEFVNDELFTFLKDKYDLYASAELRWRSVYDYHKADPDDAEERQPSVNIIVGAKKSGAGRAGIGRASPFFRFYRGVNPHGQFRNQKNFTEYGFGIRLTR